MSQCNKLILLQASNQDADFWFHQAHPGQTSLVLMTDSIKKFICKSSFHVTRQYRYCMYTIHIPRQFKWLNSFPKDKTKRIYQKLPNWMKREPGNFIQIESYTNPGSKYISKLSQTTKYSQEVGCGSFWQGARFFMNRCPPRLSTELSIRLVRGKPPLTTHHSRRCFSVGALARSTI